MCEEQRQFDSLLGGDQTLPPAVGLMRFAVARSDEIAEMRKALASSRSTKLAFQTLPKHMRRRCMSHNSKRLPRRLREIHMSQQAKSGAPRSGTGSRKRRRRSANLTTLTARQGRHKWLKTHLWHAKRFHMIERWGYRLPDRPCDKAFRACYRASAQHCLVQDISYYECVQLLGDESVIVEGMKSLGDATTGLSVAAKAYIKGNREGALMLYKQQRPVGLVHFHWRPPVDEETAKRTLWLWVHAAFYNEALECLIGAFNLQKAADCTFKNARLELTELKNDLNRIRLTGPLSNAVLQEALQLCTQPDHWFKDYCKQATTKALLSEQNRYWANIKGCSCGQLPPHSVLSLVVRDPRYFLPKKRTKAQMGEYFVGDFNAAVPPCSGPIWSSRCRLLSQQSKSSNAYVDALRSKMLVPGSELVENGPPVPVLLIQQPGNRTNEKLGYSSGWDVVLPSAWTQSVWMALILRGGRPGGIREASSIQFEQGRSEVLAPDTNAGKAEAWRVAQELSEQYFKKPPNKRTNYNKCAIACPFLPDWGLLVREWGGQGEFCVLRDLRLLNVLQDFFNSKSKSRSRRSVLNLPASALNCIVPVKLDLKRGKPNQFAIICLAESEDLRRRAPMEPLREDQNEELRREVRSAHKALLTKLKRKRSTNKKLGKIVGAAVDQEMYVDFSKKMRELWVPKARTVRNSCSREVIGFVTAGDYSLTEGKGSGLGYVSAGGLQELISSDSQTVLVRNTSSAQYRLATVQIAL